MICKHSEILFSLNSKENAAIYDNINEAGGHYAKWNRPFTEKTAWSDLHVDSYMI